VENKDAHMKEPKHITIFTIDPWKKRKKRKGGTSFSNSKQRRPGELGKEESRIEGGGIPSDLQNTWGEGKRGYLNDSLGKARIDVRLRHG
jgi:hypothetical protein